LPLAITSFDTWKKLLGKNWKRLHRLVYIISPLVLLHFALVVKGNITNLQGNLARPMVYGGIAAFLLILRIPGIKNKLIQLRRRAGDALANRGREQSHPLEVSKQQHGMLDPQDVQS